ncbi:MAG: GNAT family N-acetyltransferase [Pseudomonadota bacterium]|nr:GNAT family N-acetyltransferase [Pseudomonadota bacterium]
MPLRIAPARPQDVPVVLELIRALAEYEKLLDEVSATEAALHDNLFGTQRYAEALIAWSGDSAAGFALYFHNFSTFLAKPGVYLEDLFVRPAFRSHGIGKALLAEVARIAKQRGCGRLEWSVLNWNEPAIRFYRSLGAVTMSDWTINRVTGKTLDALAGQVISRS